MITTWNDDLISIADPTRKGVAGAPGTRPNADSIAVCWSGGTRAASRTWAAPFAPLPARSSPRTGL